MKVFFLLILLFKFQLSFGQIEFSKGTMGLLFISKDTIWFAMDTKITRPSKTYNMTKILEANNIFFTITGQAEAFLNNVLIFSADKIMLDCIKNGKEISKSHDLFKTVIIKELTKLYKSPTATKPNVGNNIMECIMTTYQNGIPVAKYSTFKIVAENINNWKIICDTTVSFNNRIGMLFIGHKHNAFNFLAKNTNYFEGYKNMYDKLVCVIKSEADVNPAVGLPVDIVTITKKGHVWHRNLKTPNSYCK